MSILSDGRVKITPNAPLSVAEMQRLYMGEGRTPAEASSYIHMNYPTEVKSHLDKSWRDLGINEAPEKYFANPANLEILSGPATEGVRNKMFNHLQQLQMLPTVGPSRALRPKSLLDQQQEQVVGVTPESVQLAKLITARSPDELYDAQTQDPTGFGKGFLQRRAGIDPETDLQLPFELRTGVEPYSPPSENKRLASEILNDPEFRQMRIYQPERAKQAYLHIVGRPLEADMKSDIEFQQGQAEIRDKSAIKLTERLLGGGAKYDPTTGKWEIPRYTEVTDPTTGELKLTRTLGEATSQQAEMLNRGYPSIMGKPLPTKPIGIEDQPTSSFEAERYKPAFTSKVEQLKNAMGRSLTQRELNTIAQDLAHAEVVAKGGIPGNYFKSRVPEDWRITRKIAEPFERGAYELEKALRKILDLDSPETIEKGRSILGDVINERIIEPNKAGAFDIFKNRYK